MDAAVQTEALKEVSALMAETKAALDVLVKVTDEAAAKEEGEVQANFYHSDVVPAMEALRAPVDKLEMIVDKRGLANAILRRPDLRGIIFIKVLLIIKSYCSDETSGQ